MFPGDAVTDDADSGTVNPKGCRHLGVRKIRTPKPSNVFLGQFGVPHSITSHLPVSSQLICDVVAISSNANVLGLHTDWPVASMKDMHAVRDGADVNAVCRNMSGNVPAAQTESTVPVRIGVPSPVPTARLWRQSRHVGSERFSLSDAPPTHDRASRGISVAAVPFVMRVAQPLGFSRVYTTINRALHLSKSTLGIPCRKPL